MTGLGVRWFFLISMAGLPASILAQTQAHWTGQGELGLVAARGNATTETGNLKFNFTASHGAWRHLWNSRFLYGRNNGLAAGERWETFLQSERKLNDKPFAFVSGRYEEDRFGGFASQATFSMGLGYDFINTATTKLSGSLGGGFRRLRPQEIIRDADDLFVARIQGEPTEDAVGKGTLVYQHQLTANTLLANNLLIESGNENTLAQNELTVQVAMTARLGLAVGYTVRHNAQPPEGQIETDQLTTVNLIYKLQ